MLRHTVLGQYTFCTWAASSFQHLQCRHETQPPLCLLQIFLRCSGLVIHPMWLYTSSRSHNDANCSPFGMRPIYLRPCAVHIVVRDMAKPAANRNHTIANHAFPPVCAILAGRSAITPKAKDRLSIGIFFNPGRGEAAHRSSCLPPRFRAASHPPTLSVAAPK